MHINNNVQKIAIENILNQIGEVYTKIGDEVTLYPLRIVSGITNFTENGEFPLNYNTEKFTSDIGVVTSNTPIVCYWEGAYKSHLPSIVGQEYDYQVKEFSAENGRKIKTWIMQYSTETITSEQLINDKAYTTISLNRNIRSFSTDWIPTDNEQRYYLYLYLDKKGKSPQFLQLVSKEPRYLPGGKLAGCELSFINLNQAYSQSGKDVLNFVKMTHPGGNYAFPKEIQTDYGNVTILDYDKINNRGVNDIQLQFYNSYWLNSITVYGAPKSSWKIDAPRKLLLCNPHPAISSSLDVDGSSLNNYFAVFGAQTLYQSFWDNWKNKVQAYYDYGAEKTYMGGFKLKNGTWQDVIDTNPISAQDVQTYNMWNNWSFHPAQDETFSTPETPFTGSSLTFFANTNYKPEDFLNHNSFIYSSMEALPMEFSETTRFTIGDFGAIGRILQGFVQIFTLGFNPGWTTNNTWVPNKNVNFLIPVSTFNFGRLMTAEGSAVGSTPIPFDCVNPSFSGCGNKTVVCGYRFQLTRYFQSPSQAIAGATEDGKGHNGIWDTKYLGQTQWQDGTWIFANHEPLKWIDDCRAISPITRDEEYEVYLVSYKGIGLTTCRMTFFNYINHDPANLESVWESRQLTNAKFKEDITLWTNTYRLNYSDEFNNEGVIDYPTNVVPPSPQSQSIRITDLEGTFNKDNKSSYHGFETKHGNNLQIHYNLNRGINTYATTRRTGGGQVDPIFGPVNCCYIEPATFLNKKSYDLTKLIGVGKLNQYTSFSFRFKSLHSATYDFVKNVTINISDLVDNTWTKTKIANIEELVSFTNADAYPRNYDKFGNIDGKTYDCYGNFNQWYSIAPVATDIYVWIKLNKTTQVIEIAFDNPTNTIYGTLIDTSENTIYNPNETETVTKTIPKSSVTNDLTISLTKFKFKDNIDIVKNNYLCPQFRIRKEQLEAGITINNWFEIGGIHPNDIGGYSINTTIAPSGNNYNITHTIRFGSRGEQTAYFDFEYHNDFINVATIRNINLSQDERIDSGLLFPIYRDNEFFRGYKIDDFFINPNS